MAGQMLARHSKEVEARESDFYTRILESTTIDRLAMTIGQHEIDRCIEELVLLEQFVPAGHRAEFFESVKGFVSGLDKNKSDPQEIVYFAGPLARYSSAFFGNGSIYANTRNAYARHARGFVMGRLFLCPEPFECYGVLASSQSISQKELDFYARKVSQGMKLNHNIAAPLAKGLVAVLLNLELPAAKIFVDETFKLLGDGTGLSAAEEYITHRTKAARERFEELKAK